MARASRVALAGSSLPPEHLPGLGSDIVALLEQPLNRKLVARRKSANGELLRYLEGHVVIQQANRIFGFGNWGSELVAPVEYRPFASGDSSACGIYSATVRVSINGCKSYADVGTGAVTEASAEAHDTAMKSAVTDALKRALRFYGLQFGLGLYDRANAERIRTANELADLRATVVALGHALGLDESTSRKSAAVKAGSRFDRLSCPELAGVVRAMAEAVSRRQQAAA